MILNIIIYILLKIISAADQHNLVGMYSPEIYQKIGLELNPSDQPNFINLISTNSNSDIPNQDPSFDNVASKLIHSAYIQKMRTPTTLNKGELLSSIMKRKIKEKMLFDNSNTQSSNKNTGNKVICPATVTITVPYTDNKGKEKNEITSFNIPNQAYKINNINTKEIPPTINKISEAVNINNSNFNGNISVPNNNNNKLVEGKNMNKICNLLLFISNLEKHTKKNLNYTIAQKEDTRKQKVIDKVRSIIQNIYTLKDIKCEKIPTSFIQQIMESGKNLDKNLFTTNNTQDAIAVPSILNAQSNINTKIQTIIVTTTVQKNNLSISDTTSLSAINNISTILLETQQNSSKKSVSYTTMTNYTYNTLVDTKTTTEFPKISFSTIWSELTITQRPVTKYITVWSHKNHPDDKNEYLNDDSNLNDEDFLEYENINDIDDHDLSDNEYNFLNNSDSNFNDEPENNEIFENKMIKKKMNRNKYNNKKHRKDDKIYYSYKTTTIEKTIYPKKTITITEYPKTVYITTTEEFTTTPYVTKYIEDKPFTKNLKEDEFKTVDPILIKNLLKMDKKEDKNNVNNNENENSKVHVQCIVKDLKPGENNTKDDNEKCLKPIQKTDEKRRKDKEKNIEKCIDKELKQEKDKGKKQEKDIEKNNGKNKCNQNTNFKEIMNEYDLKLNEKIENQKTELKMKEERLEEFFKEYDRKRKEELNELKDFIEKDRNEKECELKIKLDEKNPKQKNDSIKSQEAQAKDSSSKDCILTSIDESKDSISTNIDISTSTLSKTETPENTTNLKNTENKTDLPTIEKEISSSSVKEDDKKNTEKSFIEKIIEKGNEILNISPKKENRRYSVQKQTILSVIAEPISRVKISTFNDIVVETVTLTIDKFYSTADMSTNLFNSFTIFENKTSSFILQENLKGISDKNRTFRIADLIEINNINKKETETSKNMDKNTEKDDNSLKSGFNSSFNISKDDVNCTVILTNTNVEKNILNSQIKITDYNTENSKKTPGTTNADISASIVDKNVAFPELNEKKRTDIISKTISVDLINNISTQDPKNRLESNKPIDLSVKIENSSNKDMESKDIECVLEKLGINETGKTNNNNLFTDRIRNIIKNLINETKNNNSGIKVDENQIPLKNDSTQTISQIDSKTEKEIKLEKIIKTLNIPNKSQEDEINSPKNDINNYSVSNIITGSIKNNIPVSDKEIKEMMSSSAQNIDKNTSKRSRRTVTHTFYKESDK